MRLAPAIRPTLLTIATAALLGLGFATELSPQAPARLQAREIQPAAVESGPSLFRPVAVAVDGNEIYVLDAGDADIKVFAKDGSFRRALGKKGSGPGEFRLPGDMDILDGRLYVADSGNRRVQVLDRRGVYLEGFGLKTMPWRVLALDPDKIIVVHFPTGLGGTEKMVTGYRRNGVAAWQAVDSLVSKDRVYDAMRNQVLLGRHPGGGSWLVWCFDDRVIRRLSGEGGLFEEAAPPAADLPFRDVSVPTGSGGRRILRGFCRACASDGGRLYLLLPEYTDDGDLGPGKTIAVVAAGGRVEALIDLPGRLSRIAVEGETIYGLDPEPCLRILKVVRK